MPRQAKGVRLHKFKHRAHWYIRDTGQPDKSTGCTDRIEAEKAHAAYTSTKGRQGAANEPANVPCGEILAIYAEEHAGTVAAPKGIGFALNALLPFWAELKVTHIKGETCCRYPKTRKKVVARDPHTNEPTAFMPVAHGTVLRELGPLQTAVNYAHKEGYLTSATIVTLPPKPESRER